jgi:hypothetical protein
MVDEPGAMENEAPSLVVEVFEQLPAEVKPLFRHMVA